MTGRQQDPELRAQELKTVLQDAFTSIAANIGDTIDAAMNNVDSSTKATLSGIQKGFRDLSKFTEVIAKTEEQALLGKLSRNRIDEIMMQRRAKEAAIRTSINILERNSADLSEEALEDLQKQKADLDEIAGYNREIEGLLEKQLKHSNNINRAQGLSGALLGGLAKTTRKLGLSGLDDVFANAKNDAAKLASSLTDGGKNPAGMMGKMQVAGKGLSSALAGSARYLMGPAGIALAAGAIAKLFLAVDERTSKVAQSLGISKEYASVLSATTMKIGDNFNYMTQRLGAAVNLMSDFANATGLTLFNTEVFNEDLDEAGRLIGLNADQMTNLALTIEQSGVSSKEFINNSLNAAIATERQLGISVQTQAIMKDIADLTFLQKVNLGNTAESMGRAVIKARALGLTMMQLENISKGLLNFESSIEAEMEAELLINKELNFERARAAALNKDYATVAEEMLKNAGSLKEFQDMSSVAQEAFARSMNMSADELAKMLTLEQAAVDAGFQSAKARDEEFQALVDLHGMEEAVLRFKDKGFAKLRQQQSIQSQINMLLENMKTLFMTGIEPVVQQITKYLTENPEAINKMIDKVVNFVQELYKGESTLNSIADTVKGTITLFKGLGNAIDVVVLKPLKAAYYLAKSITEPLLNIFSGDGLSKASDSLAKNLTLSGANLTDALTGVFAPVVGEKGTNLAQGLQKSYDKDIVAEDFTIRTHPKDTLKIAGGTKFGEETNTLLKELITAVKSGGHVYMDGNKVGHTLALSTYKSY
jgi:hypothetical protein